MFKDVTVNRTSTGEGAVGLFDDIVVVIGCVLVFFTDWFFVADMDPVGCLFFAELYHDVGDSSDDEGECDDGDKVVFHVDDRFCVGWLVS